MALFKTPEEKAEARAQAAQRKAEAKERAQHERYANSPVGRATTALERGDRLFQAVLTVDDETASEISTIERVGWRLESAGYAFPMTISSSSNFDSQLSDVNSYGSLTGVYLFRRSGT